MIYILWDLFELYIVLYLIFVAAIIIVEILEGR